MSERDVEVVNEVFARVRAKDERVADLYAEDATLTEALGQHVGREEIRGFYRRVFTGTRAPFPTVRGFWISGSMHVALLEVIRPSGELVHGIDVFEMSDGVIRSMNICYGALDPGWSPAAAVAAP